MKPLVFALPAPDLAPWRRGNTGIEGVWHFDSGRRGRHVLISALIHGNELCGAWALKDMLELGLRPQTGCLTLVFANLRAFDRFDPMRHDASRFVDEDMNRQWRAEALAQPHSIERKRVAQLLPWVEAADWLLDLHSMHDPGPPLLLVGMQPRNLDLARQLGQPAHVVRDAGHSDGVRMRDYGRFGLPDAQASDVRSLLIECGFHGDPASAVVARDLCARFLHQSAALPCAHQPASMKAWWQPQAGEQWLLDVTGAVVARSAHFKFAQDWQALQCLPETGTVIGDNEGDPVCTPYDDCVLVMPSLRQVRPGVTVARLARRVRL